MLTCGWYEMFADDWLLTMATEAWDIDTPGAPAATWFVATILVGVNDTLAVFWDGESELLLALWIWACCCFREFKTFCWNSSNDKAGIAFSSFSTSKG